MSDESDQAGLILIARFLRFPYENVMMRDMLTVTLR